MIGIYVRVSTNGIKNGHTQDVGMQVLEIKAYLSSRGLSDEAFEIYEDTGFSGTKKDRPALKRLMADCRSGKIKTVICYKLDRWFRSLSDLLNTLTEFQTLGVEFVAVKDNINMTTAMGRLMIQILGAFSEFEAAVIKERINSGIANAKSKGIKLGRPFKSGHSVVSKLKAEGKTTKEIAAQTGLSRQTISRTLKKQSV